MVAVVVGASVAGVRAAQALCRLGYPGEVILVGEEAELPYDRPPLSKAVLAGRLDPERVRLLRDGDTAQLRLGVRASGLHTAAREVELATGERIGYDHLVIATGSSARAAPWDPALPVLRTLDDSRRLAALLRPGAHLAVIGGGFIGAEVASTAAGLGLMVTVVDPLPVPIARLLGADVGGRVADLHAANGVLARFGVGIEAVARPAATGYELTLSDGSSLIADVVLAGIGAYPNDGWLTGSGLSIADGVVCDEYCRVVGATDLYAAGDVARWLHPRHGEPVRIEHWTNAVEQAECVAYNVLHPDAPREYAPVEYVWSDQYDRKIQIIGRPAAGLPVQVEIGGRFAALYGDAHGRLVGAALMNWPRASNEARKALGEGASVGVAHDRVLALAPVG